MVPASRAEALIRFLLERGPSPAEQDRMAAPGFDCDVFLIELLCSDEAAARYGDLSQGFIDHLRGELAKDAAPHKLAHDLALAQDDVAQIQARLDGLSGQMIDLLKLEDRIAAVFDAVRDLQAGCNALRGRIAEMEGEMRKMPETADGG